MAITPMVAPNGVWMRTHIWQDGNMLRAKCFMAVAGEPVVFEAAVNLNLIEKALIAYHNRLHKISGEECEIGDCRPVRVAGILGSLKKAVKAVGKSKLVKSVASVAKKVVNNKVTQKVSKAVKAVAKQTGKITKPLANAATKVLKSKVVGAIVSAAAVAFPPVGVPAAAAYASANAALAAIEKGQAVRKAAASILSKAKATGKKPVISANVKKQLTSAIKLEKQAKAKVATLAVKAKNSSDPTQKADAKRLLAVMNVAAKNRATMKAIPIRSPAQTKAVVKAANVKTATANKATLAAKAASAKAKAAPTPANIERAKATAQQALAAKVTAVKAQAEVVAPSARAQGLIVTERGLIVRGAFNELPAGGTRAMYYRPGRSLPGNFQQIAGCIGCDPWPSL